MLVLLTRPRVDSEMLADQLEARGIHSLITPLLDIHVPAGPPLDTAGVSALLMTSANGVRAFVARSPARDIPVLAVGGSTAAAARDAGFQDVRSAGGDVDDLAAMTIAHMPPQSGELLHPAATHVAGELAKTLAAAGYRYRREVIYEAVTATALDPAAADAIRDGRLDGVLLYSPRTGRTFKTLVTDAGLAEMLGTVHAYCLSAAVADTVSALNWAGVHSASRPEQTALLALLPDAG